MTDQTIKSLDQSRHLMAGLFQAFQPDVVLDAA